VLEATGAASLMSLGSMRVLGPVVMAADDYHIRAAELLARSKVERHPEVAALLETIAGGFQQLADTPTLPIEVLNFAPNGSKFLLRR
jgi:hypothetical protein